MNKPLDPFDAIAIERAAYHRSKDAPLQLKDQDILSDQAIDQVFAEDDWVDVFDMPENSELKPQFNRILSKLEKFEAQSPQ